MRDPRFITTIRLPRWLLDKLDTLARRDGVPRSRVIECALTEHCLAQEERRNPRRGVIR